MHNTIWAMICYTRQPRMIKRLLSQPSTELSLNSPTVFQFGIVSIGFTVVQFSLPNSCDISWQKIASPVPIPCATSRENATPIAIPFMKLWIAPPISTIQANTFTFFNFLKLLFSFWLSSSKFDVETFLPSFSRPKSTAPGQTVPF